MSKYIFQADLFFTDRLQESNDGFRAVLLCIDTYTKFCWCEPVKSKTCKAIVAALKKILLRMTYAPNVIAFDRGILIYFSERQIKIFVVYFGIVRYYP